MSLFSVWH